ncbi:MAG: ABC transporter permease [Alphaproteobacteria bacterium]|nr:ABC transporter permease [Alphaproteobacteria bacterium]
MLDAIWRYRHFILASISGELKGRYVRSRLGLLWTILQPLSQALIFALILSEVLGARLAGVDNKAAYAIYLMSGLAAWGLFSEIVNRCLTIFIEYSGPLKKIAFPRICLPIIVWGGAIITHVLLLFAVAFVFLFFGHYPGVAWIVIPLGILLISMFAFGLGLILGIFNVFSRDVGQVLSIVMQIWFWLTPIVYPLEIVPAQLRWFVDLNPMVALVGIYQNALLYNRWPDPASLIVPVAAAVFLFALAFFIFRRASTEIVDAL